MENDLSKCFNCDAELPIAKNLNFCPYCATQLQCKNCNEVLLPKAKVCINCGTPVADSDNNQSKNVIDFEQKGTYKKFHSSFSNEVGNTLAETFVTMLGGTVQYKKNPNPFISNINKSSNSKQLNGTTTTKGIEPEDAVIIDDSDLNEVLLRHFQIDEGKLKLINSRLKHTGKLDQSIRLALLTLYAYEKVGQPQIEKSMLTDVLTSASLYDSHFSSWFTKCDEIIKDGSKVQLSVPGRETAEDILKEIADDAVTKGSITFSKV